MGDEHSNKSKLSWSKRLVRKWLNIKGKSEKFHAEEVVNGGEKLEHRHSISSRDACTTKKSKIEKSRKSVDRVRRRRVDFNNPHIKNVQNHSIFVATWNVGGKSPPSNMNLDNLLHSSPPADIYVLGFQEIVPLNASNILGSENNGPAKKWINLIRTSLNSSSSFNGSGYYTPSPIPDPLIEYDADFEGSTKQKTFFHRRSFQTPRNSFPHNPFVDQRRFSVCDQVISGNNRFSDCSISSHRPSDYSLGQRASDFSDDEYKPGDLLSPSTVLFSPSVDVTLAKNSPYCLVASKQMVGVFLTVWVRKELREHVGNIKVSCVGRGLMGYLGNKGSISMSMSLHQTSFCFICTHLTSGQKEGDELRRNADVIEILKKTRFPKVHSSSNDKCPETILQHNRIIWMGDLNYRIALSYRTAKALVEMQNWRALLEKDQLRIEQRQARVFKGWKEGKIYFPPTYKYSHNSDRYSGGDMHPKEKRRTPAWCDRILWYGSGLQQLSYVRGESRFSDHRPVSSVFWAEVELLPNQLRKSMSCSSSRIEVEELLPYSHGYTDLSFF